MPLLIGLACLALGAVILLSGCASSTPPQTVAQVDLSRYAGRWYEIAAYPAWFQRKCAGNVTAEYTPQPDGSIRVVNRCRQADGTAEESVGRARVVPGSGNARLKVSFGVPFVSGDYWILALDPNYRWVLVGHPSRDYLWILAREPRISESQYREIVARAKAQGFDPAKLRRTEQH